ncbi:MAG: hypothetical protein JSV31_03040 [Desulfobacterales bacterium]|nr:MAG: hypothetical protein JSV31_03040 [Desulfobacterales bacterium]
MQDNSPDLKHLIRSVQRLDGNPDCFRKAKGDCEHLDCVWRVYCLEEEQEYAEENKEDIR